MAGRKEEFRFETSSTFLSKKKVNVSPKPVKKCANA